MLDQIQEIVRKNLPAEVGDTLRKYMAEAEDVKRRYEVICKELNEKSILLTRYQADVNELQARLKLAGDLDKREKDVTARESKLAVFVAEVKMAESDKRAEGIYQLAALVFKNPTLKFTMGGNKPAGVDQYGSPKSGYFDKHGEETTE